MIAVTRHTDASLGGCRVAAGACVLALSGAGQSMIVARQTAATDRRSLLPQAVSSRLDTRPGCRQLLRATTGATW